MGNYLEAKRGKAFFFRRFVFVDDLNYSSVSLFYRNKVRIKPRTVARKGDEKYQLVFCDVRKKDVPMFIRSMEELKNKMLLIGNLDYETWCEENMAMFQGG